MEFTIEHGKLYMLQTRNGKRTAAAALKIAVDLVDEGKITEKTPYFVWNQNSWILYYTPQFDAKALKQQRQSGKVLPLHRVLHADVLSLRRCKKWANKGEKSNFSAFGNITGRY